MLPKFMSVSNLFNSVVDFFVTGFVILLKALILAP